MFLKWMFTSCEHVFNFFCNPVENIKLVEQLNNNYNMTWHTK